MRFTSSCLTAVAVFTSTTARADTYNFSFDAPQVNFSFNIDSSRKPDASNFYFFQYYETEVTLNGASEIVPVQIYDGYEDYIVSVGGLFGYGEIAFGPGDANCQIGSIGTCYTFGQAGVLPSGAGPIFGGTTNAPVFNPGTYSYSGYSYVATGGQLEAGSLTITELNSAASVTPEPSTIALLGTGMLGMLVSCASASLLPRSYPIHARDSGIL